MRQARPYKPRYIRRLHKSVAVSFTIITIATLIWGFALALHTANMVMAAN